MRIFRMQRYYLMSYVCKFIKIFNNNLTLTFPEQSGDYGV